MSRLDHSDLARMLENPAVRISRQNRPRNDRTRKGLPIRHPAPASATPPQRVKDRYSEHAAELGLKIRAHMEQLPGQIRLWLPYPPSTNARLANVKGRMLKSKEARSYQKLIQQSLVDLKPLTGNLEVSITINRPRKRGDIDNVLKSLFDSLTGLAFVDDEQIAELHAKRYENKSDPGIHIQIKQIRD